MKRAFILATLAVAAWGCAKKAEEASTEPAAIDAATEEIVESAASDTDRLARVLRAQPGEEQARYEYRHPQETIEYFGIEPGMTVVEALPGGGWWTKILLPYIGAEGRLVGADYPLAMWALFGDFAPDPEEQKNWPAKFVADAAGWCSGDCAPVSAIVYGSIPEEVKGTADAVLFFRALHHFSRFEEEGGYFTAALKDTMDLLKPGGVVGVEQHRAPPENSDKWAEGDNGYLKQEKVVAAFEAAGFEFLGSSEINANPNDVPTEDDFVWRLPPALATSGDNPELRAQMEAIGESDRMTLKFRKPLE
jgi:predicted methyltransferase